MATTTENEMDPSSINSGAASTATAQTDQQEPSVERIQQLLRTKNDTSRFVGLALLKTVLDNSPDIRNDGAVVAELWDSISPKFLDRLMQTGSTSHKDAKDMLDLAVAVVHTFTLLLQDSKRDDIKLVARIPSILAALVHCSDETTKLALQTLAVLVTSSEGAKSLLQIQDLSPLTEIAPSQPLSLEILALAILTTAASSPPVESAFTTLREKIDTTITTLVSSFKGTDGVTLLAFLDRLLRNLDPFFFPPNPTWLAKVTSFIRTLVTSRPAAAAREAYTNLTATLLQLYPLPFSSLIFAADGSEKPPAYLLLRLLLVDLRATLPTLLPLLNSPSYIPTATRLASALDILSSFVGHLVRSLDDESTDSQLLPPSTLLSLRKDISETLSLAIEHLRDRYDASTAGALGLHPSARADTSPGSSSQPNHPPLLAWDSESSPLASDPLALAAVRALALWLREDENGALRREAAGLMDLFMELYKSSLHPTTEGSEKAGASQQEDFRRALLVAFEGMMAEEDCTAALLEHGGWAVLTEDLVGILEGVNKMRKAGVQGASRVESISNGDPSAAAHRGLEILAILQPIATAESPTPDAWMDVVPRIAAAVGNAETGAEIDLEVAALEFAGVLLENSHPATRRRPARSGDVAAVLAAGRKLIRRRLVGDVTGLREAVEDVLETVGKLK